jgi:hypothetical protein
VKTSAMLALVGATVVALASTEIAGASPRPTSSISLTTQTPPSVPLNLTTARSTQPRGATIAPITGALEPHTGVVQSTPHIYIDFWGWSSDPENAQPYLTNFLSSIGNTNWIKVVAQYGSGVRPTLDGTWSDPAPVPIKPTVGQIQAEAINAASHFGLSTSVNDEIIVALPTGHDPVGFVSSSNPNGYCAEHFGLRTKPKMTFTVLPYIPDGGSVCGLGNVNPGSRLDGFSIVEGHELAESMTDPLSNGWYDSGGNEIGDKCAWFNLQNIKTTKGTFAVQPLWSNAANACSVKPVWSIYPPFVTSYQRVLSGVSCASVTSCMAVGWYHNNGPFTDQTLIVPWIGNSWGIDSSPNSSAFDPNYLTSVSCVSTTSCTAVGYHEASGSLRGQSLVESWNGAIWSIVPSPSPGSLDNHLSSVSCVSSSNCVAVGYVNYTGFLRQTLVEAWNGAAWSIVASPNLSGQNTLSNVACVSPTSCTAVGSYGSTVSQTLVESWSGKAWSVIPSPNKGANVNSLLSVSCPTAITCTAVGYEGGGAGQLSPLVEFFDGSVWSIVSSPKAGLGDNSLESVSCGSATSCTAVGYQIDKFGYYQTLVESSNGAAWSIIASPNVGTGSNYLSGVSCLSATSCTAVGYFQGTTVNQMLIESHG